MTMAGSFPRFRDTARCAETDPELFFPTKGGSAVTARWICARCESRTECLTWALDQNERFGIWGGTSPPERRKILARSRRTSAMPITAAA